MNAILRPLLVSFVALSILTGIAYPLVVTGIARISAPGKADGSLLREGNRIVGSTLIGQNFADPKHFWGRPSATGPYPYNASASSGSNQGPLNPALTDAIKGRIEALRAVDPDNKRPVPIDLVTASGSGLDPDISVAAARYQVSRIARERHLPAEQVEALIERLKQGTALGFLGEPRINVLELNLALDGAKG